MEEYFSKKRQIESSQSVCDVKKSTKLDGLSVVNSRVFGNDNFRTLQRNIIESVLKNEDVFVIMPTGGGKSLCYQLPAIITPGVTIVISPLISLIEDQVSALLQLPSGGVPTAYLSSTCTESMIRSVFEDLGRAQQGLQPFLKLLYVTPERIVNSLHTRDFLAQLYQNEMLARFVIDEAHCISSWGHDFRKEYGQLHILREEFPEVPILALTATARRQVATDLLQVLKIPSARTFCTGFDRTNLLFEVRQKPAGTGEAFKCVRNYIRMRFPNSSGIVYCITKRDTEELADYLRENLVSADYYHAGQTKIQRKAVQSAWLRGDVKVVCATIAYGMGIDKPDVRFVVHLSLAKCLEGYYQEAGRAGRDGNRSECVLFYRPGDVSLLEMIMRKPPTFRVSKKDASRLQEMVDYCQSQTDCRRKIFSEIFGYNDSSTSRSAFKSCGNMCDNCLANSGHPRRTAASEVPRSEREQQRSTTNITSSSSRVEAVSRPKFQKASELKRDSDAKKVISISDEEGGVYQEICIQAKKSVITSNDLNRK